MILTAPIFVLDRVEAYFYNWWVSGRTKTARRRLADWMAEAPRERTQTWIGERLGVSQSAVGQWLSGETRPSERLRKAVETMTGIEAAAWETAKETRAREALEERLAATVVTQAQS
ncbi:MAG: hypothetical protein ACM3O6_12455 [Acidobacteriota bacterium]